jgi:hypothetical protein
MGIVQLGFNSCRRELLLSIVGSSMLRKEVDYCFLLLCGVEETLSWFVEYR